MSPTDSSPPVPHRRSILVVDADGTTRAALREALVDGGFRASTADSRVTAVGEMAQTRFDLVAVDVSTPRLDGPGLIDELRRLHPDVPIVAMTATHEADAEIEAQMLGAHSFVNKPLDLRLVLAHFGAVLGA